MNLFSQIQQLLSLSPRQALHKIIDVGSRKIHHKRQYRRDARDGTYTKVHIADPLHRYFRLPAISFSEEQQQDLYLASEHFLQHRFDLLGSGWTQVKHGKKCRGLGEHAYQAETEGYRNFSDLLKKKITANNLMRSLEVSELISPDYIPVDWQLDFKSGYRWSESSWYKHIQYGGLAGVDIKVPCELGQFHHLPQLALAHSFAGTAPFREPEVYVREFMDQVLDFIAANPPRYGVQWVTTMDVAIRAANFLTAYDLLAAQEVVFPESFENIFRRSIYEHGLHIIENLEWASGMRANHYIANICGLLFIAAYLPSTSETELWLAFALHELINEVERQFLPDGGNFEASTSYHRLALERVLWTTALALGLPEDKKQALQRPGHFHARQRGAGKLNGLSGDIFPEWYFDRLRSALEFSACMTKPDNQITQIGDNDNNRFLKFTPNYRKMSVREARERFLNLADYDELPDGAIFLLEDVNNHNSLLAAGAFLSNTFRRDGFSLESELSLLLSSRRGISASSGLEAGVTTRVWKDFGLYIHKNEKYHLAVRCGPIGQNGKGGHAHNDQLSFELNVDGRDFFVDPGTYLYSPLPAQRNYFRSTGVHNTLIAEGYEQNAWAVGSLDSLFWMLGDRSRAAILSAGPDLFIGEHYGYDAPHRRELHLSQYQILIRDIYSGKAAKKLVFHISSQVTIQQAGPSELHLSHKETSLLLKSEPGNFTVHGSSFSYAYGYLEASKIIQLHPGASEVVCRISLL